MDTKKPLSERSQLWLEARKVELINKMDTLTDRDALIAHSNAILAVEKELRNRKVRVGE